MENILPVGFRFNPTDEELVKDYLLRKIKGEEVPCSDIKFFDVYGGLSPWEIFQRNNNNYRENYKVLYVFTKLKRANPNRISRVAGCGTWHEDRRMMEIYDGDEEDDGVVIGLKKMFSFKNNKNNERDEWIMNEFSLAGKYFLGKHKCDYVLCRIKKVGRSWLEAEAEAEKALSAAIFQIGLEEKSANFKGGGYVDHDHQLQFSEKNEDEHDMLLDNLEAKAKAEKVLSAAILEAESVNFHAARYVYDHQSAPFSEKNEDDHDDVLLHEFDPLLQINTEEWNLSMLEKNLMDDDDEQQQPVTMEAEANDQSGAGDWILPVNAGRS